MLDDELKHEDLIIDEKEAKRQFLEELRNKNMQENNKKENSKVVDDTNAKNSEVLSNDEANIEKTTVDEIQNEESVSKEEASSSKDTKSNKETVDKEEVADEELVSEEVEDKKVVNKEETIELDESKDEEINKNEFEENGALISKDSDESSKESKSFLSNGLKVSLIDTAVTAIASLIGVFLFDLILRLFGYHVVDFKGVYIIAFLIILVVYPVIMEKSKYGKTLGQKFGKI